MSVQLSGAPVFCVNALGVTTAGAITLIQLKPVTYKIALLRASVCQSSSTTSAQIRVGILRKTAAATVTSATPLKYDSINPTSGAAGGTTATGITATAEGTDSDILVQRTINALSGFEWIAQPMEQIIVDPGGFLALKLLTAPSSTTFDAQMVFAEMQ